jgi:acyl-CoA synthetase (AMP-forming)/AMP-acid ligase II
MELLKQMAGFDMQHVPYKGGVPAITDTIGGQVPVMYADLVAALPHIQAGKLRAIAVGSPQRVAMLPDVKTIAEQGIKGYDAVSWGGLLAPLGTPKAVVDRIANEVQQILAEKEVQDKLLNAGAIAHFQTPAQLGQRVQQDYLASAQPAARAIQDPDRTLTYAELDCQMDRVAAALQRDGVLPGQAIAVCAASCVDYVVLFLGALRAGVVVAPLAPSVTPDTLGAMLHDAQAQHLWVDASTQALVPAQPTDYGVPRVSLLADLGNWMAPPGTQPQPVAIAPEAPFNIIYSSGTTGMPKGIVQSHGMRWTHVRRGLAYGYGPGSRALLSTPLYSNTTLVVFFPTLAFGGCVVLMPKFDARNYLQLAQQHAITHTMLVPVQYQRLMAVADFDTFDLSAFQMKFCTSAPFSAALKAEVLRRWPGGLVEFYGMTEGGGTCLLNAHEHPDKLHTVGRPADGHDIRLIDEDGND